MALRKKEYKDVYNTYKQLEEEFKKDSDLENLLSTPQLNRIKEWLGENIQNSNKNKEKLLKEIQEVKDSTEFSTGTIVVFISFGVIFCGGAWAVLLAEAEWSKKELNLAKK